MAVLRAPSVDGLNGPIVSLYREREMAGAVTNLYLLQQSMRIVSELGSFIKIRIHFLEKRETFCHSTNLNVVTGEVRRPRPTMI